MLPELFLTPLAWINLGHVVVDCINVPGNICFSWEWLVTDFTLVLRVLMFCFWMDCQARLWLVTLPTIHALEGGLLRLGGWSFFPNPGNPLNVMIKKILNYSWHLLWLTPKNKTQFKIEKIIETFKFIDNLIHYIKSKDTTFSFF